MNCSSANRPVVFAVISVFAVVLIYGLSYTFSISDAYARILENPVCSGPDEEGWDMCCKVLDEETDDYTDCDVCRETSPGNFDCDVPDDWWESRGLVPGTIPSDIMTQGENPPTPLGPRSGPRNLLPEGVFEGPTTSPEGPTKLPPQVDCTQTPNDPLCETAVAPETAPTELTPQVDCAQNPEDPLCETATIPESENESQTKGRIIGESPSPTGYCAPIRTPTCIPCDPGLPGSTCVPESDWPPTRTTDTGTPEEAAPLVPPITGPLGETAPQVAPSTAEDGTGQPPTEPLCPEGQVHDEESGICVPEQPETPAEEPAESQPEEEQPTEESDSGEGGNN
jgi:hypothetical protein